MSLAPSESALYDVDRTYLSRLSFGPLVLGVMDDYGQPTVADGQVVTLTLTREFGGPVEEAVRTFTAVPLTEEGVTLYQVRLPSVATAVPGPYTARWTYTVDGTARMNDQPLIVGPDAPAYDRLTPEMKDIVEAVWIRTADQFDSPLGGPHLQVYRQTHYNRNRIAMLLPKAIGRMNTVSQPHQTYSLAMPFPVDKWGPLLELALWVETIKHLRRSYLEQPDVVGTQVARLDRQRYSDQWATILREEEGDLRSMLDNFKIASLNLGTGSVLVSGGAYPRLHGRSIFGRGLMASRGYFPGRGY